MRKLIRWVLPFVLGGCAATPTPYEKRQAEIDGAYQRGEISLVEKEQMTHALEQERQARRATALQLLQSQSQYHQPAQPAIIYPRGQSYNIYDQNGNQTGTLQPR